ncbi:outer membrane protein with beta-barrel domain [Gramella sp. Hel_I_59]|uniref:porin family protein n=1 Tax=Gramella sp. Hel_I_59 TaxID=1249978 RepID=UPI001152CC12|nr:porin family protein [Gramella sp. Hel_I_59]TQI71217.1 outer membrane protein with beta-barrel domain [Gramella sp. Hel_I_59]
MKRFLFLLIALTTSININAQDQYDFKIGVNAGLNYPDIRGNEYAKYNNFKVGYLVGVSLEYYLNQNLSLKSNLNYERKIKKLQLTYYDYNAEETGKENFREITQFINFPVLLKYEFMNSKFFLNGGGFLNIFLDNAYKPDFPIDNINEYTEKNNIDAGFSAGAGINIPLNEKNWLILEIRDDFGIIDIGGVPQSIDGKVQTNSIKLILSWNFGI